MMTPKMKLSWDISSVSYFSWIMSTDLILIRAPYKEIVLSLLEITPTLKDPSFKWWFSYPNAYTFIVVLIKLQGIYWVNISPLLWKNTTRLLVAPTWVIIPNLLLLKFLNFCQPFSYLKWRKVWHNIYKFM